MSFHHWNKIAIEVAVFLLHQDHGEQYLAQIIRFYKGNPLQLLCKIFVWLFQFYDTIQRKKVDGIISGNDLKCGVEPLAGTRGGDWLENLPNFAANFP